MSEGVEGTPPPRLSVPTIGDDWDLLRAAVEYANAGWYVGPLRRGVRGADGRYADAKNPGSILGKRWQSSTTRDLDQIAEWFVGCPEGTGIFLHVGRSGACIFDVDHPERVPEVLARLLWVNWDDPVEEREARVPYQSTRPGEPSRGHYLVLQPIDRTLGNGHGDLGGSWGEVRGNNGIIVAEPTVHENPDVGLYRWEATGFVPPMSPEVDAAMPSIDAKSEEVGPATDVKVKAFLDEFAATENLNLLKGPLRTFAKQVDEDGASRHDMAVKMMCQMMREARMGYYPARDAARELYKEFVTRLKGTKGRFPRAEFQGIIAWAVGQIAAMSDEEIDARRHEMEQRLVDRDERRKAERVAAQGGEGHMAPLPPERDPLGVTQVKIDPDKYFWDKSGGIDIAMLGTDVLDMGPLAMGRDGYFWRYEGGVWRPDRNVVKNRVVQLLGRRYRQAHASNAADVVGSRVIEIGCEPVKDYLNCRNGMVDWRTGKVLPHSPDFLSTVQFPFDWPDEEVSCPKFDKFLDDMLSPDYKQLVWEMIGYLLFSGNPRQIAFLHLGEGMNGKGTLLRVLSAMLGVQNYACESLSALSSNKFSAINLFGKIANIAGDMDATFQTETAMFKALTGEDVVSAEHKYGTRFQFECWATPVFSINKIPGSADTTKGYLRRWLMVKWDRTLRPEEVVAGLSDTLLTEIPAIAQKALPHLRKVMQDGFKLDGEIALGLEEFAMVVDQVRLWIDECCEPVRLTVAGQPHRVNRSDLYRSYKAWAEDNRNGILKAHEFFSRLSAAGYKEKKVQGVRYIEGLKVMVFATRGESYDKSDPWVDSASTS
jgi:putative DNA primase/helicase